ncbi:hypothetical protein GCM10025734_73520 [Kitasatospora paranensis]
MRALAADDRDLRPVGLVEVAQVLLGHRDSSEAVVSRLISGRLPSDESAGRPARPRGTHPRTFAPGARNRTASRATRPASLRPQSVDDNTRTSCPHFLRS